MLMVFNDNISVTSLWSVLLVELTGETTNLQQGIANFYHMILYPVHIAMNSIRAYNFSGDRY